MAPSARKKFDDFHPSGTTTTTRGKRGKKETVRKGARAVRGGKQGAVRWNRKRERHHATRVPVN